MYENAVAGDRILKLVACGKMALNLTLLLLIGRGGKLPPRDHFRNHNSRTKNRAMRFRDFTFVCLGYKMLCLSVVRHRPKIQYGSAKIGSMQAVCCYLWFSSYLDSCFSQFVILRTSQNAMRDLTVSMITVRVCVSLSGIGLGQR